MLLMSACAAQPAAPSQATAPPPSNPSTPASPTASTQPGGPQPLPATTTALPAAPAIPLQPTATHYSPLATLPQAITPLPLDSAPAELVAEAITRLTEKIGLNPNEIKLFSVTAVEWPDASLGCPIGGQQYAPVVTPGYQIQLQAGEEIYTFHTDTGSQVRLCSVEPPHEIYQPP